METIEGASDWQFLMEIIGRSALMFFFILLVLRITGKKGVRQLTLFEVAIILGLGSAAGDPMFYDDVPVVHGILVLFTVILCYRGVSWLSAKYKGINKLLEGSPLIVVQDGKFELKSANDNDFSMMEFFTELRNSSIEHLGQVRTAILEVDGSMSVLYYPDEAVKYGLPIFPQDFKKCHDIDPGRYYACMYCGEVRQIITKDEVCTRCSHGDWTTAKNDKRIS